MQSSAQTNSDRVVQTTPKRMYSQLGNKEIISNVQCVGEDTNYTAVEVLPDGGLMLSNDYGNSYISKNVPIMVTFKKASVN